MIIVKHLCPDGDTVIEKEFNDVRSALLYSVQIYLSIYEDCLFYYKSFRLYDNSEQSIKWNLENLQNQIVTIKNMEDVLNT